MNCANHPEIAATAYCRSCGKPLCENCKRAAQGTVFCEEHFPAPAFTPSHAEPASPYTATYPPHAAPYTATSGPSPGLAFLLGLIPGVGAIYNGQYAKGLLHVIVLGLLISILSTNAADGFEPLFGMLIPLWFFYMAFEAYHTAAKRQKGEPVEEFSGLVPLRGRGTVGFPVGPIAVIALGIVFLLNTMEIVSLRQIVRYWPVFLILLGAYMLYARLAGSSTGEEARQ